MLVLSLGSLPAYFCSLTPVLAVAQLLHFVVFAGYACSAALRAALSLCVILSLLVIRKAVRV